MSYLLSVIEEHSYPFQSVSESLQGASECFVTGIVKVNLVN